MSDLTMSGENSSQHYLDKKTVNLMVLARTSAFGDMYVDHYW